MYPIASKPVHVTQLVIYLAAYVWLVVILRKRRTAIIGLIFLPVIVLGMYFAPAKPIESAELKNLYMRNLSRYQGTLYIWGGENRIGIDCSGLPRKSLRLAYLELGVKTFNGACVREYVRQWWHDASAKALSQGYRGYAVSLGMEGKVSTVDDSKLEPGDLAITKSGVHVMVYFGTGKWIQADPEMLRVVILDGRTSSNRWFSAPVKFYRWSAFQTSASGDPSGFRG